MCHLSIRLMLTFLAGCTLIFGCHPGLQPQAAFATEEKENATFRVRITAFREARGFGQVLGGAYYVFETQKHNKLEWKRFMVYNYDDPIPIDDNSIGFVNDDVGYVVMINKFAVTADQGTNWSMWDISRIESLKDDRSCRIQRVSILENGNGSMHIKCNNSSNILSTTDFGVSWKE